jgi:hypothetical protein
MDRNVGWNHAWAVFLIALSCWVIYTGLTGEKFYALGPGQRPTPKTRIWPKWLGRLWFLVLGLAILYWSVPGLRGPWRWGDLVDGLLLVALIIGVIGLRWLLKKYGPEYRPDDKNIHR